MSQRVTPTVLARLRLVSQALLGSTIRTPAEAVRWMTAMQGQDLAGALHSVALRVPGTTREDVRAALDAGLIVRSWPLRGTLHLTAAEDLGWMMGLTSERIITGQAARHRQLGITTADVETARDVALGMLDGGRSASREDLQQAFQAAGQETAGQRGIHLLWLLNLTGTLVQGPTIGAKQLFVLLREWIPNPRTPDRDEAVAELVLRYFRSHGPATITDFTGWSKLTLRDARAGLDAVKDLLVELPADARAPGAGDAAAESAGPRAAASKTESFWLSPESAALLEGTVPGSRSLLLLPGFDEYLLGYADRSAALDPDHLGLIVPGGNGMFKPTIVAGGRVVGTWRRPSKANGAVVEPLPFGELTPSQNRGFSRAADAYARILAQ